MRCSAQPRQRDLGAHWASEAQGGCVDRELVGVQDGGEGHLERGCPHAGYPLSIWTCQDLGVDSGVWSFPCDLLFSIDH